MRIFLAAAVVLIVFAVIASAVGHCLGVTWDTWLSAALLAFFVDLLWPLAVGSGGVVRRPAPPL